MPQKTEQFHGSDLEKIEKKFGIKKENITSFSANVNPLGISPKLRTVLAEKIDAITTYPDRDYVSLRKNIADYLDTEYNHIIVGNGSTELISLFIQIEHPKKALILGPTYLEYEREVFLGGGTSLYYPLIESENFILDVEDFKNSLNETIDLLVICNPNNPTSTAIPRSQMRKILDYCKQYDITVMVDETYVEFAPDTARLTAVPLTQYYNNLIILRGISKFFAAPGLRLGYAVTGNRDLIKEINARKNPWTINSLAAIAGELMFTDEDYIRDTKKLISDERTRIYKELIALDSIKVYEPTANFMLVKILREDVTSSDIFYHCIQKGYMIRDCSTFPFLDNRFFRFCFMDYASNQGLLKQIYKLLGN